MALEPLILLIFTVHELVRILQVGLCCSWSTSMSSDLATVATSIFLGFANQHIPLRSSIFTTFLLICMDSSSESDGDEVFNSTLYSNVFQFEFLIVLSICLAHATVSLHVFHAQGFQEMEEEDVDLENSAASDVDTSPIPDCEGIDRYGWGGKALLARHADGSDFAEVSIFNADPNACIDGERRLGNDHVGIVVLEVYNGDPNLGDMCLSWPTRQLFDHGDNGHVSVYDHARKRDALDKELEGSRKREGKRQYRYDKRARAAARVDKKAKILSHESIANVFMQPCCDEQCTRKFSPLSIRTLRTEMHLQSFQVKCTKNLEVHKAMHIGVQTGKKVITVEGIDVCARGWRILHNISLRTFHRYAAKARANVRGGPHGNFNRTKKRTSTIQAIESLRPLLEAKADQMPHLSCTLPTGKKVCLKVLPAGTEWKLLLATVNEVRITSYLPWCPHFQRTILHPFKYLTFHLGNSLE